MFINQPIGVSHPPYIICEISANHNGDLERAKALLKAGKEAGADAIKLQTYTADTITLNSNLPDFQIRGGLWDGENLYELYEGAHTPWEWHKPLFDYAKDLDITIFSSPFDTTAVDLLEDLDVPAYKVASFEVIDLPLIRYIASTGKPMIMSTGMANKGEIAEAIRTAKDAGCKELAILHCVSGYPAPSSDYNLRTLVDMQQEFGLVTGLSDHTLDNTIAIASVALGASIIEKHFILDRSEGGPDSAFSLEPDEFKQLCEGVCTAWEALGRVDYGLKSSEKGNIKFRRSLYYVKDLQAGDVISEDAIRSVRPGYGAAPKYHDQLIGRTMSKSVMKHTPVHLEDIAE